MNDEELETEDSLVTEEDLMTVIGIFTEALKNPLNVMLEDLSDYQKNLEFYKLNDEVIEFARQLFIGAAESVILGDCYPDDEGSLRTEWFWGKSANGNKYINLVLNTNKDYLDYIFWMNEKDDFGSSQTVDVETLVKYLNWIKSDEDRPE